MNLVTPDAGLLFWMVLIFGIVLFILAKWGFPVITGMVEKRSEHIDKSLALAREAQQKVESLATQQSEMVAAAKKQEAQILSEAMETKKQIIAKASEDASMEAISYLEKAQLQIETEKENALREVRGDVASLSVDIAEKILRRSLSSEEAQLKYIDTLIDEMSTAKEEKQQ